MPTEPTRLRLVVLAPNWLGDAVMALPALHDIRRHHRDAIVAVAARTSLTPLFKALPDIDEVVPLSGHGGLGPLTAWPADAQRLANREYDRAILLPNSFGSAWLTRRAGIPERWGYATDGRSALLTRAVRRPAGPLHQVAYYQWLVAALGIPNGPVASGLEVPADDRARAETLLANRGLGRADQAVAVAPGAAYGHAKRWRPRGLAEVIERLALDKGVWSVLVGSQADREGGEDVSGWLSNQARLRVLNLIGQTDLGVLMGVLARSTALVSNDSGAMHLASALGLPVTAMFGPTDEHETAPAGWADFDNRSRVLTSGVWCRPCMLRECPLDHRCMTDIRPAAVLESVLAQIAVTESRRERRAT